MMGMTKQSRLAGRHKVGQVMAGLAAAVAVLSAAGASAYAQKAKPKAKPQSAWVKLCENANLKKADKSGKVKTLTKKICLTHHERLDGNTGMVIISAAVRQVEGQKNKHLMIMVPLGMALPAGVKAAVYNPEQWERARKKQKVDDKELNPISLKYTLCHPAGCTAEIAVSDKVLKEMKSGGGLMVLALNSTGRPVAFPVSLAGFAAVHKGKPIDGKKYGQARAKLMASIRQRMRAKIAKKRGKPLVPPPKKN